MKTANLPILTTFLFMSSSFAAPLVQDERFATPSSFGVDAAPTSFGLGGTPSSFGVGAAHTSFGHDGTPTSFGHGGTPSSFGVGAAPTSFGLGGTPSSFGFSASDYPSVPTAIPASWIPSCGGDIATYTYTYTYTETLNPVSTGEFVSTIGIPISSGSTVVVGTNTAASATFATGSAVFGVYEEPVPTEALMGRV